MDNDTSNKISECDSLVVKFKHEVESALQTFVHMSPSEKAEASILWNITSEKLQEIINNSANAMKNVSFIVIKSSNNNSMKFTSNNTFTSGETCTSVVVGNGRKKERTSNVKKLKTRKRKEIESRLRNFLKESENSQLISKSQTILHVNTKNKNEVPFSKKESMLKNSDEHTKELGQPSAPLSAAVVVLGIEEGPQKVNNSNNFIKSSTNTDSLSLDSEKSNDTHITVCNDDGNNRKNMVKTVNLEPNIVVNLNDGKTDNEQQPESEGGGIEDQRGITSSPSHSTIVCNRKSRINNNSRITKKIQVVEKNRWSCNSCEKQFDDYITLQYHISCEHSIIKAKQFQCTTCQVSFSTKSNLNVHLRRHSGERPFICKISKCSFKFTTSNNLRRHILSHHQNLKPYTCSICDSSFSEKRSLQVHLRRHSGLRPFRCSECGKNFAQKKVLRNHMSTHSTEKTFLCTQCPRSFKLKTHLRAHEVRHQGDKTHTCCYCKASFFTKSDLNRHEQSHREERRFACKEPNCSKKFMRNQSLKEHIKRHHGIQSDT